MQDEDKITYHCWTELFAAHFHLTQTHLNWQPTDHREWEWGEREKTELITGELFLEHAATGGVIQTGVSLGIDASEQQRQGFPAVCCLPSKPFILQWKRQSDMS